MNKHEFYLQENLKKVVKIGERYDQQLARITGNTEKSSPMFIKLISKNLSRGHMVNQQIHSRQSNSDNNEEWWLNKSNSWYSSIPEIVSELKRNTDKEMDEENEIRELKKSEMMKASCIANNEKQKYVTFKESLRFWNLSLEPVNLAQHSLDIQHISMINRKCSTDQKSTFCYEEIINDVEDLTNTDTNMCNISQESKKCHEFCINIDPENGYLINSTEYACQEGNKSTISTFIDWIQTIIHNKTSVIMVGQNENVKNSEFQIWTQQILQNLDVTLALNNYDNTMIFSDDEISNNIIRLSQWIEFAKFNVTTMGQEIAWQLLKQYQQYDDENISSNLIRICMTNQGMGEINCTEQYHYNICHLDNSDKCMDDNVDNLQQTIIICRQFMINNMKIEKIKIEYFCNSLNETNILLDYQQKASRNTTDIIILQLIHTILIHSIPFTTPPPPPTTTTTATIRFNQYEKERNDGNNLRLKINEEEEEEEKDEKEEKIIQTIFPELSKSVKNLGQFNETNYTFTTINSLAMQTETIPETEIFQATKSNLIISSEMEQNFDNFLNDTTIINVINSNDMNVMINNGSDNTING
uniref:Uncharacterized protein n=1 Tax=Loa loa TaxID=7209 RepID=A0A1I7W390_LOALO